MPRYIKQFADAIPAEFCQHLIDKFELDAHIKDDPQPEYSTRRYINISQQKAWIKEMTKATQIVDPFIEDYFRLPEPYTDASIAEWFNDGFIVAKYKKGDHCGFHDDAQTPVPGENGLRYLTAIFFLNDVPEGGELHFPVQEVKIKPKRGTMVLFPAQVTHPHEVLPTLSDRYVLQTWVTDTNLVVVDRGEDYN